MHHLIGAIVVGLLAGGAASSGGALRQGLRRLVRSGIVAKRKADAVRAMVLAQARGIVDEARADLDQQATRPPS